MKVKYRIGPNQKDADLWGKLADRVSRFGPSMLNVCKVVSHQRIDGAADEAEAWIFRGNAAADSLAASAFHNHPALMAQWTQLCQDVADVCILREHVHKVVIQVAQKSFSRPAAAPPTETALQQRFRPDQIQAFHPTPLEEAWNSRRFAIDRMEITSNGLARWWIQKLPSKW